MIIFFLELIIGVLDLILNFPGYHRWKFTDVLRNFLKIIISLAWSVVIPVCYFIPSDKVNIGSFQNYLSNYHQLESIPQLYILVVCLYLVPNALAALLFIFPMLRRWIENSDWLIIRLLLWWSQVSLVFYSSILMQYSHLISIQKF